MLHFRPDGRRLINGEPPWSYHTFIKDYRLNPKATLPLAAPSPATTDNRRSASTTWMCIAYGSDAKLYASLIEKGYLPQSRARSCKKEFNVLQFGLNREILPHIDRKMGDKAVAWRQTGLPPHCRRRLCADAG